MHRARASAACLLALVLAGTAAAPAAAQDAAGTRERLQQVRKELKSVAAERREVEGRRSAEARELRTADERVARAARQLREVQAGIAEAEAGLQRLQSERTALADSLADRRGELAGLLRAAQAQGGAAPLKLLLAQDRVADANRLLAYHGYLQRDRVERIRVLAGELAELDRLEAEIARRRDALEASQAELDARIVALDAERSERQALVAGLEAQFKDRQAREKALGRDAKALEDLLARLREAAAKAEAERRAAAAAAAREAERAAREAGTPATTAPRPAPAAGPEVGGAGWPVDGRLLAGYGATMPDGRKSQGLLVGAPAGSTVRAARAGMVVYAEWMSGFGLILIIDHGDGNMSLYAHNEALLREAGERVSAGDAVATVGSSGGHGQPALYFELRRGGQPVDPRGWLGR
ncbi:peptidoglycan DD-metalloendopeptidase family protein [Lysobacter sp. GX 14042]|uniref:murein hydrolase activator EnvC family protein n=1 Tax=Lysobacter sp. GX 14042 TaxID=2907155 RepID=UPI001F289A46|nr:peptidoglycan DD-metalloendopeptidase family protein [Lysobacter sp. GX 14042]MCE7033417.1 peptidoglycan DD-metalloendopeptidase family protein [Lysobacter sp. GX 14042]